MRKIILALLCAIGVALACRGFGGDAKNPAGKASGSEIEKLVRDLASSTPATREAASKALQKIGKEALPFLKAVAKSPDAEQKRRAADLFTQIYESWIEKRADLAAKYGIDVAVERMVRKGKDLTEEEWDVFANIVEKIRTETKWGQTLPPKKYLHLPVNFDPKDNDIRLWSSRLVAQNIIRNHETDRGVHATLAICRGTVKVLPGVSSSIVFANGDIDCGGTGSSMIVCGGTIKVTSISRNTVIVARGTVKLENLTTAKNTTIFDDYRNEIPGVRFFPCEI